MSESKQADQQLPVARTITPGAHRFLRTLSLDRVSNVYTGGHTIDYTQVIDKSRPACT
jgi:hypothetical protein